jgi:hypothetical protein
MIRETPIFVDSKWSLFIREDSDSVKPFSLIVKYFLIEKPCKLVFEIITDMASSFSSLEVYETMSQKITREFPELKKQKVAIILDMLDIISIAQLYTSYNDEHLAKLNFH